MIVPLPAVKWQTHLLEADFAVIGGGMAGLCAALSAARNGAKTVLVQDRSVLGGNASSEVKMHIVGSDCHGWRPGTRESGLIEELRLEDAFRNPHRSYSQWDLLLYEKVVCQAGITLLLDTTCIGCETDSKTGNITRVTALRNSTEDLFIISAPFFADCSGDSHLALECGAEFTVGRESREEYGESLALANADLWTLGSSILITARKYDEPQPFRPPAWVRKFTGAELKHRPISSYEYGYWWFEWGGHLDTVKDNETIRHELLRIALGIWDFVKNSGCHPDSANWALDWVGAIPGKRESRRLMGKHVLTQGDVQSGRLFEDAVAYGGWAIDLHPPQGVDAVDEPPYSPTSLDQVYTIPLRSLRSRNVPNLLFAGRNISATHVAFASTRVMATCAVMGQAIGAAAALAVKSRASLEAIRLHDLQQQLLKDDAFIPAIKNEDSLDKARAALVTASDFTVGCTPELVIDGISRDLIGRFGPWADQKIHHWRSLSLPAWIELKFERAVTFREMHLTFDSGFQRELNLSASDHITKKQIRGPQPELVRAYRILGDGVVIATEEDNYLRKRIHRFPSEIKARTFRIEIGSTRGVPEARLFEVRIY